MEFINLDSNSILAKAIEESHLNKGVVIFKHSTRCSISSVAKKRLSTDWFKENNIPFYYLDLIKYRDLSGLIAEKFNIQHESPQVLIIKNGKCIYDASHLSISIKQIESSINQ